jgi:ribosome-associated heat shock protein Hsp15
LNRAAKRKAEGNDFLLDRQRVDKWLWHARVVRTRTTAAALADKGCVRINGHRIDAASRLVRPGDIVTVALDRVRVLKVLNFSERRGSATDASVLFEDLAPPQRRQEQASPVEAVPASRDPGAGRPTKRDRRAIDRLMKL